MAGDLCHKLEFSCPYPREGWIAHYLITENRRFILNINAPKIRVSLRCVNFQCWR